MWFDFSKRWQLILLCGGLNYLFIFDIHQLGRNKIFIVKIFGYLNATSCFRQSFDIFPAYHRLLMNHNQHWFSFLVCFTNYLQKGIVKIFTNLLSYWRFLINNLPTNIKGIFHEIFLVDVDQERGCSSKFTLIPPTLPTTHKNGSQIIDDKGHRIMWENFISLM